MPIDYAARLSQFHQDLIIHPTFDGLSLGHVVSAYANPNPMAVTDDLVDRSEEVLNKRVIAECRPDEVRAAFETLHRGAGLPPYEARSIVIPADRSQDAWSAFTVVNPNDSVALGKRVNQTGVTMLSSRGNMVLSALFMAGSEAAITSFFEERRGISATFRGILYDIATETLGGDLQVIRDDAGCFALKGKNGILSARPLGEPGHSEFAVFVDPNLKPDEVSPLTQGAQTRALMGFLSEQREWAYGRWGWENRSWGRGSTRQLGFV